MEEGKLHKLKILFIMFKNLVLYINIYKLFKRGDNNEEDFS